MKIQNIRTDNIPLLDEVVYTLKILLNTCVSKDENKASINETLKSMKMSDRYITCIEGNARFEMFNYNREILEKAAIPEYMIDECVRDRELIPKDKRKLVLSITTEMFINNYIEENNYYRTLNGLPNYGEQGILVPASYLNDDIRDLVSTSEYVHEMSEGSIDILYSFNIIDKLKVDHPNAKYLDYMGSRKISIYKARKAVNFALLYTEPGLPEVVVNRFKDKYENNRVFTLKTVYADAFKFGSDYYDNFIQIFILIQTMIDIISELPDMIIKREIFDIRMVKLIFESNGVDFFPEIPFKYQMAMVRNLNRLIKYKSTTKNIIDICSLFGFNNIEVFKYYLLRQRKVDKKGEFEFHFKTDEFGNQVEDLDKNYDLKFIKVPIDDIADNYLNDKSKIIDYNDVVLGDKYWNGDLPHEVVRRSIVEKEFNYMQSKYLSVDTIYSMADLSFQLIYFYNMIFDDVRFEEMLKLKIPTININKEFRFVDIVCFLYSLMYEYNNFEDDVYDNPAQFMYIKGFNFKADINTLASYIEQQGFTMEELGVSDFQIPDGQVMTYNQLLHIFTKNKNIHDHVVKQMYNADNKKIYDIYKKIYESLMLTDLTNEFFRKDDGTIAKTYTDYIRSRDPVLYDYLLTIKSVESLDHKREKINNLINDIIYIIEQELETDDFNFIFSQLPSVSAEAIKMYIYKVINFFKSYKVDIHSINTIYKFDDKLENKIKMIDHILINHVYTKQTTVEILEKLKNTSLLTKEDKINLIDQLYIEVTYWVDHFFTEDFRMKEGVKKHINTIKSEPICLGEYTDKKISLEYREMVDIIDKYISLSSLNKQDIINIIDTIYMETTYWLEHYFRHDIEIKDIIGITASKYITDKVDIDSVLSISSDCTYKDKMNIGDNILMTITFD